MKIRRLIVALTGVVALTAPLALAAPAEAATPRKAITCGMVVTKSVDLYLARDLTCAGNGVGVYSDVDQLDVVPTVTIDLRGHTLRGRGEGTGIDATGLPSRVKVTVAHGQLKNWDIAVTGDSDTRLRGIALTNNRLGLGCGGSCSADWSAFTGNETGVNAAFEADAVVTRSTFVRNEVGAEVGAGSSLSVDRSLFVDNRTGIVGNTARPISTGSTFVRNTVAVQVNIDFPEDQPWICADLTRPTFYRNARDVVGPRCTD